MTELLTAAQMQAIEQDAMECSGVTGLELMERAGRGVVEAILREWPDMAKTSQKAVVLCGPGNNGGDGFVVARLLKQRGWEVEVFLYGAMEKLPPDAKVNAQSWLEFEAVSTIGEDISALRAATENTGIFIDALFGGGLARPLPEIFAPLGRLFRSGEIEVFNDMTEMFEYGRIVAIDIPSGLCASSGRVIGDFAFKAGLTVTFERPKFGHYLEDGPAHCGRLSILSIGIDDEYFDLFFEASTMHTFARVAAPPQGLAKGQGHKYSHGHALVLAGPEGRGGAARLAARGALRIGSGLVTLGCPYGALAENAARLDAIMLREIDTPEALRQVLQDERINGLCLGPGMGLNARTREMVEVALESGRPAVLDADALSAFKSRPEILFEMLHKDVVITPHMGEVRALVPEAVAAYEVPPRTGPALSRHGLAVGLAGLAGCTVLIKGADTVIAKTANHMSYSSTHAAHYDRAAPWLATAGAGDVLAGFVTGLMARGFAPMHAAEQAAWLHVQCALEFGPGLIAEDIPEQIPAVLSALLFK